MMWVGMHRWSWVLAAALVLIGGAGSPTSPAIQPSAGLAMAVAMANRTDDGAAERVVVFGGGGLTGQAWQIGLVQGLREAGIDLTVAEHVIGTSGGSMAAAQLRSGELEAHYAALLAPPVLESTLDDIDLAYYQETARMWQGVASTEALRIAVGARALAASPVIAEDEFIARSAVRVGVADWPRLPLQITAVDIADGTLQLIDASSGAPLAVAVAASTAQPGLAAPITIGERRYMDGGVGGSPILAAAGHRRILALVTGGGTAAHEAAELVRAQGGAVLVLAPDAESAAARGPDSQDPTRMRASAEAGRHQGLLMAAEVTAFWNGSNPGE